MTTCQELKIVGLDGRSQPMYRYAADMHLPDHARRIVAVADRPDSPWTCEECGDTVVVDLINRPRDPDTGEFGPVICFWCRADAAAQAAGL